MYSSDILPHLRRILKKLAKKDPVAHQAVESKMLEIVQTPQHYKALGSVMKGRHRVHFGSFVLVFSIDEASKTVIFEDFSHHDKIYQR
jgi:YafQ family addiction module toxin component